MSTQLVEAPPRPNRTTKPRETTHPEPEIKSIRASEVDSILHVYDPSRLKWKNVDWTVAGWMLAMHVGCVAALFFVTWQAVAVAVILHWMTCSIGICLGYHRFLSHCSLKLRWPARAFVTLCGVLSGEGSPLTWSANHRVHHARSDRKGDPHSPNDGSWWSHILWLFIHRDRATEHALHQRYAPDLLADPVLRFFERTYGLWLIGSGVVLFAIGGWPFLLWGLCARMVVAYHSTWFVNSATHIWGYRNYETTDRSRNLWWVALLSYGEGWHNNHHAFPTSARFSSKWFEFDLGWQYIRTMQSLGLARVRKLAPKLIIDFNKRLADLDTVRAIVANRLQVMTDYARVVVKRVYKQEKNQATAAKRKLLAGSRRLLIKHPAMLDANAKQRLEELFSHSDTLQTVHEFGQRLQKMWQEKSASYEHLLESLQEWCNQAEATGIEALQEFAAKIRGYTLQPV